MCVYYLVVVTGLGRSVTNTERMSFCGHSHALLKNFEENKFVHENLLPSEPFFDSKIVFLISSVSNGLSSHKAFAFDMDSHL